MSDLDQSEFSSWEELSELYSKPQTKKPKKQKKQDKESPNSAISFSMLEMDDVFSHELVTFAGVEDFEANFNFQYKPNYAMHCMLFDSVNPLDFLRYFIKDYIVECTINTWNFNDDNLITLNDIIERQKIAKFNFYLSDTIFKKYPNAYNYLMETDFKAKGEVVFYKTHSKVMLIEFQDYKLSFLSSMSLNTTSHIEQATLCTDSNVYDYYYKKLREFKNDYATEK